MNISKKKEYIRHLINDVQKARSIFYESKQGGTKKEKEICDRVGSNLEPWLFGDQCILNTLEVVLNSEDIDDVTILNLSVIAQGSTMLGIVGHSSGRKDPTPEDIFKELQVEKDQ